MKRYIISPKNICAASDVYYSQFRSPVYDKKAKAARLATKLIRDNGYYAVCYAVSNEARNKFEWSDDGALFTANSYKDYRNKVKSYCNGVPENQFLFFTKFKNKDMDEELEDKLDWSQYDDKQRAALLKGLRDGVDVSWCSDPAFTPGQMEALIYGLRHGVDVSDVADPSIPVRDMKNLLQTAASNLTTIAKNAYREESGTETT